MPRAAVSLGLADRYGRRGRAGCRVGGRCVTGEQILLAAWALPSIMDERSMQRRCQKKGVQCFGMMMSALTTEPP